MHLHRSTQGLRAENRRRLHSYPQRPVVRQLTQAAPGRRREAIMRQRRRRQAGKTRSRCCSPLPNTALRRR
jgi:hypothetical protein